MKEKLFSSTTTLTAALSFPSGPPIAKGKEKKKKKKRETGKNGSGEFLVEGRRRRRKSFLSLSLSLRLCLLRRRGACFSFSHSLPPLILFHKKNHHHHHHHQLIQNNKENKRIPVLTLFLLRFSVFFFFSFSGPFLFFLLIFLSFSKLPAPLQLPSPLITKIQHQNKQHCSPLFFLFFRFFPM